MVNINLLPEKVRAAEVLKIIVVLGTLSLILPLLFWAYQYTTVKADLSAVNKEIASVDVELNSPHLKQVVEEVEQFGKDRDELDTKRSIVDLLRKKQVPLLRFLDVLPDLIPKRAYLTHLEVIQDAKGVKTVDIEGVAFSPEVVADFYANLQANAAIRNPTMDNAPAAMTVRGKAAVKFKLGCEIEDQL